MAWAISSDLCPTSFPTNFYWYGNKRAKPGRPSKKVVKHLSDLQTKIGNLCADNRNDLEAEGSKTDDEADNPEDELPKQTS